MSKNILTLLQACGLLVLLAGCDVDDPAISAAEADTSSAKTLNDDVPSRSVSVYLEVPPSPSHSADLDGRIVVAVPVFSVSASIARAHGLTEGVKVVYVGKSCSSLLEKYPDLSDCVEEESVESKLGDAAATVATDNEGFATMVLGGAETYRLQVQSWATEEDAKCYWGGESTVGRGESGGSGDSEVIIPLLIFCE